MLEVTIVAVPPEGWVRDVSASHSALIKITDLKSRTGPVSTQDFIEVSSPTSTAEALIKSLSQSDSLKTVDLVRVDPHRVVGTIVTEDCPLCSTLSGYGCSILAATTTSEGKMEWKLLVSSHETLKNLAERLASLGVKFDVTKIRNVSGKEELTARQEEIARIAFELGYFEFPRKTPLNRLASQLGISSATLSEILRRAEKNILSRYFSSR